MLILICCIVLLILGIVAFKCDNSPIGGVLEMLGILATVIGGFGILLVGITVPLTHMDVQSEIHKIEALQQTVQQAREDHLSLEKATIQKRIAKKNEWIRSTQYWNTTVFDMWIPDKVEKLEPIE